MPVCDPTKQVCPPGSTPPPNVALNKKNVFQQKPNPLLNTPTRLPMPTPTAGPQPNQPVAGSQQRPLPNQQPTSLIPGRVTGNPEDFFGLNVGQFTSSPGTFQFNQGQGMNPLIGNTSASNNPVDAQSNLMNLLGQQFGPHPDIQFGQGGIRNLIGRVGGAGGGVGGNVGDLSRLNLQAFLNNPASIPNFGEQRQFTGFNRNEAIQQGDLNRKLLQGFAEINQIPQGAAFDQANLLGADATALARGLPLDDRLVSQVSQGLFQGSPQTAGATAASADLLGDNPLASQRAQAFRESTFDPLRDEMLADLGRRGVLDSTARLDSERELFEKALINPLLGQDLQARQLGIQGLLGAGGQNLQGTQTGLQGLLGAGGQGIQRFGALGDLAGQRFGQARSEFLDPANLRLQSLGIGAGREQGQGALSQSGFRGTEDFFQNLLGTAGARGDQDFQNDLQRIAMESGLFGDVRNFANQFDQQGIQNAIDLIIADQNRRAGIQTSRENREAQISQGNKALIGSGIGATGGIIAAAIM